MQDKLRDLALHLKAAFMSTRVDSLVTGAMWLESVRLLTDLCFEPCGPRKRFLYAVMALLVEKYGVPWESIMGVLTHPIYRYRFPGMRWANLIQTHPRICKLMMSSAMFGLISYMHRRRTALEAEEPEIQVGVPLRDIPVVTGHFDLHGKSYYRKSFDSPLYLCVPAQNVEGIITESMVPVPKDKAILINAESVLAAGGALEVTTRFPPFIFRIGTVSHDGRFTTFGMGWRVGDVAITARHIFSEGFGLFQRDDVMIRSCAPNSPAFPLFAEGKNFLYLSQEVSDGELDVPWAEISYYDIAGIRLSQKAWGQTQISSLHPKNLKNISSGYIEVFGMNGPNVLTAQGRLVDDVVFTETYGIIPHLASTYEGFSGGPLCEQAADGRWLVVGMHLGGEPQGEGYMENYALGFYAIHDFFVEHGLVTVATTGAIWETLGLGPPVYIPEAGPNRPENLFAESLTIVKGGKLVMNCGPLQLRAEGKPSKIKNRLTKRIKNGTRYRRLVHGSNVWLSEHTGKKGGQRPTRDIEFVKDGKTITTKEARHFKFNKEITDEINAWISNLQNDGESRETSRGLTYLPGSKETALADRRMGNMQNPIFRNAQNKLVAGFELKGKPWADYSDDEEEEPPQKLSFFKIDGEGEKDLRDFPRILRVTFGKQVLPESCATGATLGEEVLAIHSEVSLAPDVPCLNATSEPISSNYLLEFGKLRPYEGTPEEHLKAIQEALGDYKTWSWLQESYAAFKDKEGFFWVALAVLQDCARVSKKALRNILKENNIPIRKYHAVEFVKTPVKAQRPGTEDFESKFGAFLEDSACVLKKVDLSIELVGQLRQLPATAPEGDNIIHLSEEAEDELVNFVRQAKCVRSPGIFAQGMRFRRPPGLTTPKIPVRDYLAADVKLSKKQMQKLLEQKRVQRFPLLLGQSKNRYHVRTRKESKEKFHCSQFRETDKTFEETSEILERWMKEGDFTILLELEGANLDHILYHPKFHEYLKYLRLGKKEWYETAVGDILNRQGETVRNKDLYNGNGHRHLTKVGTIAAAQGTRRDKRMVAAEDVELAKQAGIDISGYAFPPSGPGAIYESLHAQTLKQKPGNLEHLWNEEVAAVLRDACADYPPIFPKEFHQGKHGLAKLINAYLAQCDSDTSTGYSARYMPGSKQKWKEGTGPDWLLYLVSCRLALCAAAGDRIHQCSAQDLVEWGMKDPLELFTKEEAHKPKKVEEKSWRLIWNVSLLDNCMTYVAHNTQNKADIAEYQTNLDFRAQALGLGHHDDGIVRIGHLFDNLLQICREEGLEEKITDQDASGWDLSVNADQFYMDAERRAALHRFSFDQTDPAVAIFQDLQFIEAARMSKHIIIIGHELYEFEYYGQMGTGSTSTAATNSTIRRLTLKACGAREAPSVGDDVAMIGKVDEKKLTMTGCIIKEGSRVSTAQEGIDYTSHRFIKIGGREQLLRGSPWECHYLNIVKMTATLVLRYKTCPNWEVLAGLGFALRNTPEASAKLDAFLEKKGWDGLIFREPVDLATSFPM